MGRHKGLTDEQLAALDDYEGSPALDHIEKLVVRYAVEMTQTPVEVPDDVFDGLKAKLTSKQLVELTAAIAWENYRARFDHAFGIESEGFLNSGMPKSF